jgi:hypothetical protein
MMKAEQEMTSTTINHENDQITLACETTVGECGLDPSTDGSCGPNDPVRIVMQIYWSECDARACTDVLVEAPGLTLRDALNNLSPKWLPCRGIDAGDIYDALDRVCPQWLSVSVASECTLEAEHEAYDRDNEDAWLSVMNHGRADVNTALSG